jgi:hypothetical protein
LRGNGVGELGALYLRQNRRLWTNVLVHAMIDTTAMLLLFFGVDFV